MKFDVLRQHYGDKQYFRGDEREADPGDVKHLVEKNVLRPVGEKGEQKLPNKAEPKPDNKAAPKTPNKAA